METANLAYIEGKLLRFHRSCGSYIVFLMFPFVDASLHVLNYKNAKDPAQAECNNVVENASNVSLNGRLSRCHLMISLFSGGQRSARGE